jgi:hypothetical protein
LRQRGAGRVPHQPLEPRPIVVGHVGAGMDGECDQAMPVCKKGERYFGNAESSSSGWESRPTKATARQVGSEPCAETATPRRCVGTRANGPCVYSSEIMLIPSAESFLLLEGSSVTLGHGAGRWRARRSLGPRHVRNRTTR